MIYPTNAIENLHSRIRPFSGDEAAAKLIWLVLRHITAEWKSPWEAGQMPRHSLLLCYVSRPNRRERIETQGQ